MVNLSGRRSLLSNEQREIRIYGGVRRHMEDFDVPASRIEIPIYMLGYAICAVDFPLTVVGDTVTLPIVIHKILKIRNGTAKPTDVWPLPHVLDE